jgi:hypothetical protein
MSDATLSTILGSTLLALYTLLAWWMDRHHIKQLAAAAQAQREMYARYRTTQEPPPNSSEHQRTQRTPLLCEGERANARGSKTTD